MTSKGCRNGYMYVACLYITFIQCICVCSYSMTNVHVCMQCKHNCVRCMINRIIVNRHCSYLFLLHNGCNMFFLLCFNLKLCGLSRTMINIYNILRCWHGESTWSLKPNNPRVHIVRNLRFCLNPTTREFTMSEIQDLFKIQQQNISQL